MNETENLQPESQNIQFCAFWIASRLFGVNILDVKEISSDIQLTPVFHAPKPVSGYMNIRGQIHLVIDIRSFFGLAAASIGPASRVVLFKPAVDEPFGIIVDKMDDVITVDAQAIEDRRKKKDATGAFSGSNRRTPGSEMTGGICKLAKGLLVVLNARGILQTVEAATETVMQ